MLTDLSLANIADINKSLKCHSNSAVKRLIPCQSSRLSSTPSVIWKHLCYRHQHQASEICRARYTSWTIKSNSNLSQTLPNNLLRLKLRSRQMKMTRPWRTTFRSDRLRSCAVRRHGMVKVGVPVIIWVTRRSQRARYRIRGVRQKLMQLILASSCPMKRTKTAFWHRVPPCKSSSCRRRSHLWNYSSWARNPRSHYHRMQH